MIMHLKELRLAKKVNQQTLANHLNISRSTVSMWETGSCEPDSDTLIKIAEYFGVSVDFLLGRAVREQTNDGTSHDDIPSNILPMPKMIKKPLLGNIACGEPILAIQNIEDYVDVPEHIRCDFVLQCKGDSMIDARIFDGDYVYIQQQEQVEDGQIAAVLIDDAGESEATLKRVYITENEIQLVPENRTHRPQTYRHEEMNQVRIIGRAVAFTSIIR